MNACSQHMGMSHMGRNRLFFLAVSRWYFFAVWKDTVYNIPDHGAEILKDAGNQRLSASENRVLVIKAVVDDRMATVQKIAAKRP